MVFIDKERDLGEMFRSFYGTKCRRWWVCVRMCCFFIRQGDFQSQGLLTLEAKVLVI